MTTSPYTIHGYELIKPLGTGTFGIVWEGRNKGGHRAAIKLISRRTGEAAARVELAALQAVKELKHAHLLSIIDSYCREDPVVIIMELADGTLLDRLNYCKEQGQRGIPVEELLHYMRQVAGVLDYLHGQKRIHRDVKPSNLMLFQGPPPVVKLGDCGLMRKDVEDMMRMTTLGTPAYISPETWRQVACFNGDQYSLAITYVELRQGEVPLKTTNAHEMSQAHQMFEPNLEGLTEDRAVVGRALEKDPKKRFPSCQAFVEALESALNVRPGFYKQITAVGLRTQEIEIPQHSVSMPNRTPRPERARRPIWLALAAALLLIAFGAGIFAWFRSPQAKECPVSGPPNAVPVPNPDPVLLPTPKSSLEPPTLTIKPHGPVWVEAGGDGTLVRLEVLRRSGIAGNVGLAFAPPQAGLSLTVERDVQDRLEVRVKASANAQPGYRRFAVLLQQVEAMSDLPRLTLDLGLEVHVMPRGLAPVGLPIGDGQWCFPKLRWQRKGERADFLLLHPRERRDKEPGPFYIQENKVTNGQFRIFADEALAKLKGSLWQRGGSANGEDTGSGHPRHPVLRVTWQEAKQFAEWLGGELPSPDQLDRATDWPGPFQFGRKVAICRTIEGPADVYDPIGRDDVSPAGVRGLGGNGREWTNQLRDVAGVRLVTLRGQSYTASRPARVGDLVEMDAENASPFVGFRVVLRYGISESERPAKD